MTKWFFHPIFIFILSIVALATSLFLYIYWYVEVSAGLKSVVYRFNLDASQVLEPQTWVVIMVLSILVGIILLGIFIIFVYNQKTLQLYRLQHNFINNFTHELKTPVTSLKLFLQTFSKHELSRDDQVKYIQYMITDVTRLSDHINRILNLARIESKSYKKEFMVSDLFSAFEQFYKNNDHLFKSCEIKIHRPASPLLYSINPPLLEMLWMNLLINAIKYNESKVPRIDITFEKQNKKLLIRFKDNGIGLEQGKIKKIFKKFYQVGRATDFMSTKGSGLGLHVVQNIARIHKGKVVAESKGKGQGSAFTLILPA
jgi:signal transduction histidine kinase